jgi:hypothetical protein
LRAGIEADVSVARILGVAVICITAFPGPAKADDRGLLLVLLCPAKTTVQTCTPDNARDSVGFAVNPATACPSALKALQASSASWVTLGPGEWLLFQCLEKRTKL